jgi:hypothetical protein
LGVPLLDPTTGEVREFPAAEVNRRIEEGWSIAGGRQRVYALLPAQRDENGRPRSWTRVSVEADHANELIERGATFITPNMERTLAGMRNAAARERLQRIYAENWNPADSAGVMVDRLSSTWPSALGPIGGPIANELVEDPRITSLMAPVSADIGEALFNREFTSEDVREALDQRRLAHPIRTLMAELEADVVGAALAPVLLAC